jgi:hypothetical protein
MPPKRTDLTPELLWQLYIEQGLSKQEIGRRLGCSPSAVTRHLREHHIPERTLSAANTLYPRHDFDGTDVDRAYLLGFRLGDLHVRPTTPGNCSIQVSSRTSRAEQAELFRNLFGKYGYAYVKGPDKDGQYVLLCRLNNSFSFLLPKVDDVPEWIRNSRECSTAFAAGYTDAEGSFYTFHYKCKARNEWRSGFNIASQDSNIIAWFHQWLLSIGATCPAPVADRRPTYARDVWLIVVRRKASLLALIETLSPYLRHSKRQADMERVRQNILERNRGKCKD